MSYDSFTPSARRSRQNRAIVGILGVLSIQMLGMLCSGVEILGGDGESEGNRTKRMSFISRLNKVARNKRVQDGISILEDSSSEAASEGIKRLFYEDWTREYEDAQINAKAMKSIETNPDIFLGHTVCMTCGKGEEENLLSCDDCQRVGYCSVRCFDEDAEVHKIHCKFLQKSTDDEPPSRTLKLRVRRRISRLLERVKSDHSRNDTNAQTSLIGFFEELLPRVSPFSEFGLALSAYLSFPLTLCDIALRFDRPNVLDSSEEQPYIIHIVGAGYLETVNPNMWGIFSRIVRAKLQEDLVFKVYLIGPEVENTQQTHGNPTPKSTRSPPEAAYTDPGLTIYTLPFTYSKACTNLRKEGGVRNKPNLVVFFNAGLSATQYEWDQSIREAVSYFNKGTLLAVTGGSRDELLFQLDVLEESYGVQLNQTIVNGWLSANRFGSLQFLQSGSIANEVHRKSAWISILRDRSTRPPSYHLKKGGSIHHSKSKHKRKLKSGGKGPRYCHGGDRNNYDDVEVDNEDPKHSLTAM